MARPILLSVEDDSDVLRAMERDLRSQYGASVCWRIVTGQACTHLNSICYKSVTEQGQIFWIAAA
jgi:hypothetical protein